METQTVHRTSYKPIPPGIDANTRNGPVVTGIWDTRKTAVPVGSRTTYGTSYERYPDYCRPVTTGPDPPRYCKVPEGPKAHDYTTQTVRRPTEYRLKRDWVGGIRYDND